MAKKALTTTVERYQNYLQNLKSAGEFNLNQQRLNNNIAASLNSWIIKNGVVSSLGGGVYRWVSRKPIGGLVQSYIDDYRSYTKQYWRKQRAKKARQKKYIQRKANNGSNKPAPTINYDYVTTQNMLEEIKRMKMNPSKYLNEELCIQFLKESPKYEYQIVRITKETL